MPNKPRVQFFSLSRHSRRYIAAALGWLPGSLRLPGGHLPLQSHPVAREFAGVGVAASPNPDYLPALERHLDDLGVKQVRVDYCQASDLEASDRLLARLVARGCRILLHPIQPFDEARQMETLEASERWGAFLQQTLDRWGQHLEAVEIGSTINRKRWAGYSLEGFIRAWQIGHREVRARNLLLVGPSVTDFEPLHSAGMLSLLRQLQCLPDIYSNNLFAERTAQPENPDQKILGQRLAPLLQVNLIKKARLLLKVASGQGLTRIWSPSAFWTLPRIGRVLIHTEQQQADYLTRYLTLCAASGALERAWWGPLVCAREGLIDDGTGQYPGTERITRYDRVDGEPSAYRRRPAFNALTAFAARIPGSHYRGRLSSHPQLEAHAFDTDSRSIHVLWVRNGRAARLDTLYGEEHLNSARAENRDGLPLAQLPLLVTQSPLYLSWPVDQAPALKDPAAPPLADLVICPYSLPGDYYPVAQGPWRGMIRAASASEAEQLLAGLHPDQLPPPDDSGILRRARNAIWTLADPRNPEFRLVVKQPVRLRLHKKITDRFKPSKARRSWNGACELLRRGIATPLPIAFIEHTDPRALTRNWYFCDYMPGNLSVRSFFSAYARGETSHEGVGAEALYRQLADFLRNMHDRGVFFRDLSGGNILVQLAGGERVNFALIDTGRATFAEFRGVGMSKRIADLKRTCHKLHWEGRHRFMALYLEGLGQRFHWGYRLPFHLYDLKAGLKRRLRSKR